MHRFILALILLFPIIGCAGVSERTLVTDHLELSLVNAPSSLFAQKVRIDDAGEGIRLHSKWPRPMLLGRDRSRQVLIELFDTSGKLLGSRRAEYGPGLVTHKRRNRPLTLSQYFPIPADSLSEIRITFFTRDAI